MNDKGRPWIIIYLVIFACLIPLRKPSKASAQGKGKLAIYRPNPHYLQDANGNSIFLVGPYDYSPVHNRPTFWQSLLDVLSGNTNYVRIGVSGMDIPGAKLNPYVRVPYSGETNNGIPGKFDLTQFDQVFFNNLNNFIATAEAKGIFVHISFFNEIFIKYKPSCCGFGRHPFGNGNHINADLIGNVDRNGDLNGRASNEFYDVEALYGKTSNPKRLAVASLQRKFMEKVLSETSQFSNVFCEIGNEISAPAGWIAYWVDFIRARADNPITVNDAHDRRFNPSSNPKSPVEGATYHGAVVRGDNLGSVWPSTAYDKNKLLGADTDGSSQQANPDRNREGAWLTFVSGGGLWADYAEKITHPPDNPTLQLEATYVGYLLDFIKTRKVKFWDMSPHNELTNKGKVLAKPGVEYVIYFTKGGSVTVDLSDVTGSFKVEWYNPRTGDFSSPITTMGGGSPTFTSPDSNDWVLYINSVMSG